MADVGWWRLDGEAGDRLKVLLVALALAAWPASAVMADADLWWHLAGGRWMIEHGALHDVDTWSATVSGRPWTNHEWAPELAMGLAWKVGGTAGLLALRGMWLVVLLYAWLDVAFRRSGRLVIAVAVVGVSWPLLSFLANLRPQTLTWAMVAVVLAVADRVLAGRRWAVWGLPVAVWAWANLHGGFLYGQGLAGLALLLGALGWTRTGSEPLPRGSCLLAMVLTILAPCLTPYGLDLPVYVLTEIGAEHPALPEWNPPTGLIRGVLVLWATAPLFLHGLVRRWPDPYLSTALAVAVVGALSAAKFVALVMIVGAMLAAEALGEAAARAARDPGDGLAGLLRSPWLLVATGLVVIALQAPFIPSRPGSIRIDPAAYPTTAMAWLVASDVQGVLATPLGWGGMAIHHLEDRVKVTMDGRNTTVYPVAMVQAHAHAWTEGEPEVVLAADPVAALVRTDQPMHDALTARGWREAWRDETATVLTAPGHTLDGPARAQGMLDFPGGPYPQ